MRDEGVIKFNCVWNPAQPLPETELQDLLSVRQKLFSLNLIGVYPDGISFGNLSRRIPESRAFIISGSQTGHLREVSPEHFSTVTDFDIALNRVMCEGPVKASSESLTHAMLYELFPAVNAIVHVHSREMWTRLKGIVPTTAENVSYGTPEMARQMKTLRDTKRLEQARILVMAGHEDGIVTFGENLLAAQKVLLSFLRP